MAALIIALATATAVPHADWKTDPIDRWQAFIAEAAAREGLPEAWVRRVIRAESDGQTMLAGRPITSVAGAMGLMQLMPSTWSAMRARLNLGGDPFDPHDNILAGTAYLRMMYDRFGYPGLFGAYNAGPGRFAAHLGGRPLPMETTLYMAKVAGGHDAPPAIAAMVPPAAPPSLFMANSATATGPDLSRSPIRPILFVVRHDLPAGDAGSDR